MKTKPKQSEERVPEKSSCPRCGGRGHVDEWDSDAGYPPIHTECPECHDIDPELTTDAIVQAVKRGAVRARGERP